MPANAAEKVDYMKIPIKTSQQVAMLRAVGHCAAQILEDMTPHVVPGVTKHELNKIAYDLMLWRTFRRSEAASREGKHDQGAL